MGVNHGGADVGVSEQLLNGADIVNVETSLSIVLLSPSPSPSPPKGGEGGGESFHPHGRATGACSIG